MKNLKEFILESINEANDDKNFPKDIELFISRDLQDIFDGEMTFHEWADDYFGPEVSDYKEACDYADTMIHKIFKSVWVEEFHGNFFPDEADKEDWKEFYEITGLTKNSHGVILYCDGDDADYTICVFKRNPTGEERKWFDYFLKLLSKSQNQHYAYEF